MYRNILVAIDGSQHSQNALQEACGLVKEKPGAKLTLINVVLPLPSYIWAEVAEFEVNLEETAKKNASEMMSKVTASLQEQGIAYDEVIAVGEPATEICRVAEERGCDLIVIGSRGLGQMQGFILGSVSSRVLHDAKSPVLVVK